MNAFFLTETEFVQLLNQKDNHEAIIHRLPEAYREFIIKVTEMCRSRKHKGYAISALLVVEVEISHLQTEAEREAINKALATFISKALAFVRSTISNLKDTSITLVDEEEIIQNLDLKWSANKSDLVELAYAFKVADCFGPKASVKDIVAKLAEAFKVDMPENYIYKKYNEIKVRAKDSRTYFLDSLGEKLRGFLKKIDAK